MIDRVNTNRHEHILTIEDPIEFLHTHKNCVVSQRELGSDTSSFADALRSGLRQDPDVVLVGEMRDLETIEMALRVAETGHLTLATLHTNTAASTITRIIDVFPASQQPQIRTQLSNVLEGIMCQALLPNSTGTGRVMAMEILIPNSAVRNLIREDKIHQIYSMMQTGNDKFGMQTLNQSLAALYRRRDITLEAALSISSNEKELLDLVGRSPGIECDRRFRESRLARGHSTADESSSSGSGGRSVLTQSFMRRLGQRSTTASVSGDFADSPDQLSISWDGEGGSSAPGRRLATHRRTGKFRSNDSNLISISHRRSTFAAEASPARSPFRLTRSSFTTIPEFSERTRILALDGDRLALDDRRSSNG
jgi:hypothetical protein